MRLVALVLSATVGTVLFSFADPQIKESSGLVDLGSVMVTTNDSGDDGRIFIVAARGADAGKTVGVRYYGPQVDVEALAPSGPDHVWIGDIGDNDLDRTSVQVRRVPVGQGIRKVAVPSYDLAYPDGPHDAETLLVGPRSRLYIVTKGLLGGGVYRAPAQLSPDHRNLLTKVAEVSMTVTDGAVLNDGTRVILRSYGGAYVFTFPGFRPIGAMPLPKQPQGEGISVGPGDRLRVSSEGEHSQVYAVPLPAQLTNTPLVPPVHVLVNRLVAASTAFLSFL